jgi:shikimate dehydrogenase
METAKTYALLGNPVAHSLSPLMHNAAYARMGIDARYVALCPNDIGEAVRLLRGGDIYGASVTIPFKVAIMKYLDHIDEGARQIGAVNTVCRCDGRFTGYNTDWQGFVADLKARMDIGGKRFIVVGAGGAARAVVYGLLQEKGLPVVVNRTAEKAAGLAAEFGCSWLPFEDMAAVCGDCLVNTTPVGMFPNVEASPAPKEILPRFRNVVDIVYNPIRTKLLQEAEAAECITHTGLGMFVGQGAEQIRLWTGMEPPLDVMKHAVTERLGRL